MTKFASLIIAVILSVGFSVAGFFIGDGLRNIKTTDRFVNVRGLSERSVKADTAELTIRMEHSGNTPAALYPLMDATQKQVETFLKDAGLKDGEATMGQWIAIKTSVEDLKAQPDLPRMTMAGTITVSTHNMEMIQNVYSHLNDLRIKTNGGITDAINVYRFKGIGPIRADMIAEATKDARNAALQFATDSGSKVGSIRNASQGAFQITAPGQDSDNPDSIDKIVRVVTTVDYALRD